MAVSCLAQALCWAEVSASQPARSAWRDTCLSKVVTGCRCRQTSMLKACACRRRCSQSPAACILLAHRQASGRANPPLSEMQSGEGSGRRLKAHACMHQGVRECSQYSQGSVQSGVMRAADNGDGGLSSQTPAAESRQPVKAHTHAPRCTRMPTYPKPMTYTKLPAYW